MEVLIIHCYWLKQFFLFRISNKRRSNKSENIICSLVYVPCMNNNTQFNDLLLDFQFFFYRLIISTEDKAEIVKDKKQSVEDFRWVLNVIFFEVPPPPNKLKFSNGIPLNLAPFLNGRSHATNQFPGGDNFTFLEFLARHCNVVTGHDGF